MEDRILTHYTTQEAAQHIIQSESIWMTDFRFLNDHAEWKYSWYLLQKLCAKKLDENPESDFEELWAYFAKQDPWDDENIAHRPESYVFSLSRNGDDLSQWRSYCRGGVGVALGFDCCLLQESLKSMNGKIVECIYNVQEQQSRVIELLKSIENVYVPNQDRSISHALDESDFRLKFQDMASSFKDAAFKAEREVRLVVHLAPDRHSVKTRSGRWTPIPFIEAKFVKGTGVDLWPIRSLSIGPSPHQNLAQIAFRQLLSAKDVRSLCKLEKSVIPFRSHW